MGDEGGSWFKLEIPMVENGGKEACEQLECDNGCTTWAFAAVGGVDVTCVTSFGVTPTACSCDDE